VHSFDKQEAVFRPGRVDTVFNLLHVGRLGYFTDGFVDAFAALTAESRTVFGGRRGQAAEFTFGVVPQQLSHPSVIQS
jgi:hypothetical protein